MQTCKYQRIVSIGQNGDIDTPAKFAQLTEGIDLADKSFLDVGCNCGEMCRLAAAGGAARTLGIDINRDYIQQARALHPGRPFTVQTAYKVGGEFDVVLASAVLHYLADYNRFFAQMARVCKEVLTLDIWLNRRTDPCFVLTSRGLFIPNEAALRAVAEKWFGVVEKRGRALSPDASERHIFHMREPKPKPAQALLLYGPSGSGKTTRARDMLDYEHLQLDLIFIQWRKTVDPSKILSVSDFVDGVWKSELVDSYLGFHAKYLRHWLNSRRNLDVVIEGYDLNYSDYRSMVREILRDSGWLEADIEEVQCDYRRP
jgi:SAM-dependent methyltransferase